MLKMKKNIQLKRVMSGVTIIEASLVTVVVALIVALGFIILSGSKTLTNDNRKLVFNDALSTLKGDFESKNLILQLIPSKKTPSEPGSTCSIFPFALSSQEKEGRPLYYCVKNSLLDQKSVLDFNPGSHLKKSTAVNEAIDEPFRICLLFGRLIQNDWGNSARFGDYAITIYFPNDELSNESRLNLSPYELFSYLECPQRLSAVSAKAKAITSMTDIVKIYEIATKRANQSWSEVQVKWFLREWAAVNEAWGLSEKLIKLMIYVLETILSAILTTEGAINADALTVMSGISFIQKIVIDVPLKVREIAFIAQLLTVRLVEIAENKPGEFETAIKNIETALTNEEKANKLLNELHQELIQINKKGILQ